ncbi:helix-turn-helix domain-containing protein [Actinoplanes sp. URMC 104]|uniref:helix-turn-helix domain-containing protein n=1 Tax=Actinoplanes sp. URMC 104 TaxID=3423409 RepID=UPI003F1AD7B7
MGAQNHSVPAVVTGQPCEVALRAAGARLRPYVLGFSGFRSWSGEPFDHLLLPLASTTVVVDFGSRSGLVMDGREKATTRGPTSWGHGISVGLTPLGAQALLGVPMGSVGTVALHELLGPAATELPGMLGAAPGWEDRFDVIETVMAACLGGAEPASGGEAGPVLCGGARLGPGCGAEREAGGEAALWAAERLGAALRRRKGSGGAGPDRVVMAAWRRLQAPERPRVGALAAELGVSRRRLERDFRRHIGMSPATVARIARFQRVVARLGAGATLSAAAADSGYADHSHLARETRAMAGLTPTGLAAHLATPPVRIRSRRAAAGAPTVPA